MKEAREGKGTVYDSMDGFRECHVKPDVLLVYDFDLDKYTICKSVM